MKIRTYVARILRRVIKLRREQQTLTAVEGLLLLSQKRYPRRPSARERAVLYYVKKCRALKRGGVCCITQNSSMSMDRLFFEYQCVGFDNRQIYFETPSDATVCKVAGRTGVQNYMVYVQEVEVNGSSSRSVFVKVVV